MAMGFSTSGNSGNVVQALVGAHRRGLFAVGLAGYDGGAMAACAEVDHCLVVRSESVHRIQESQAALVYTLWSAIESRVGAKELP